MQNNHEHHEDNSHSVARRIATGLFPFVGLVLIWMLLWGDFSLSTLLTGAAVGAVVSLLFYLPALRVSEIIHPIRALIFFARLVFDICMASVTVAWMALGPRPVRPSAIIRVPLLTRSDVVMTFTAEAISVVPGSIVVDIDRENAVLGVHVLAAGDLEGVEKARQIVLATERRIALAFGSLEDRDRIDSIGGEPA